MFDKLPYLLKPGTSQNDQKLAKTSRDDPKPSITTPKKLRNHPKRPKISKLGKSRIFYWLSFFKFRAQKFYFGPKSINFLIF